MATPPVFAITAAGLTSPSYADVLAYLTASYQSIYGSDADLDPDTQDGQWIAIQAQAIFDAYQAAVAVYNSFSPTYATGVGLDSLVQINGLTRLPQTQSVATVQVTGFDFTDISGGVVGDSLNLGTRWDLPTPAQIPSGGSGNLPVVCETPGATTAAPGTLSVILTPTLGWLGVSNPSAATPGQPGETDAALRARRALSTSTPALSTEEAIYAAVAAVPGVQRLQVYVNPTGSTDSNGVPAHSIAVVPEALTPAYNGIAQAIFNKKSPGTGTAGTQSIFITDNHGIVTAIHFTPMAEVRIIVTLTVKALTGFVSASTVPLIQASIAKFISELDVGEDSYLYRLLAPASLSGQAAIDATGMTQAQL